MTPTELYNALDNVGIEYQVVEIFEGMRVVYITVEEEDVRNTHEVD